MKKPTIYLSYKNKTLHTLVQKQVDNTMKLTGLCKISFGNKIGITYSVVDSKLSVHDIFLEYRSSGTLKIFHKTNSSTTHKSNNNNKYMQSSLYKKGTRGNLKMCLL
jgi:hypothetical protein